jgi:hypothetical protein
MLVCSGLWFAQEFPCKYLACAAIIFCFTAVVLIRLFCGVLEFLREIPENLLASMGISVSVTLVSAHISGRGMGKRSNSSAVDK